MVFFDLDCWMNSEARFAISASGPDLGVGEAVWKDQVVRHQGKTAEPRYTSIIRGQNLFVKWQLSYRYFGVFDVLPAFLSLSGRPYRLPNGNCQAIHYP
jgi:hypothetical protein